MKSLKGTVLFSLITVFSYAEAEESMTTWFGDPDLQGTWTNASLTTLERPDNYTSLLVTEEQANSAATQAADFTEAIDNPMKKANHPKPEKMLAATILLGWTLVLSYFK